MSTKIVHSRPDGGRPLPEVELQPGTTVIGDLHLDLANAGQVTGFCERLRELKGAPRLIILGDLFEYWVGPAQLDSAEPVLESMRDLAKAGTAVDIIPGNRDFLLERRFEERSMATLREAGMVGILPEASADESRVLLIHGDELCTLDLPYQRMKRVIRSRLVRAFAFSIPGPIVRWIAGRLRRASKRAIDYKASASMQQQDTTCRELSARAACRTLVCGHAHRFRDDRFEDGLRWVVVDAFGGERDTLLVSPTGELEVQAPSGTA